MVVESSNPRSLRERDKETAFIFQFIDKHVLRCCGDHHVMASLEEEILKLGRAGPRRAEFLVNALRQYLKLIYQIILRQDQRVLTLELYETFLFPGFAFNPS